MLPPLDLAAVTARLAEQRAPSLVEEGSRAAVAVILRQPRAADEVELLFIRRAEHPNDPWSGHMAFPGGRHDPCDLGLLDTAVRETREEVGIDLESSGRLVASLPEVPAMPKGRRIGLIVAPFVFALHREVTLAPNHEVAEAIWAPIGPLVRGECADTISRDFHGTTVELPCVRVAGHAVWGLTYQMLQSLFGALEG